LSPVLSNATTRLSPGRTTAGINEDQVKNYLKKMEYQKELEQQILENNLKKAHQREIDVL